MAGVRDRLRAGSAARGIVCEIDFRTLIAGYRPRSAIARSMTM
jgi:hypothetical protein